MLRFKDFDAAELALLFYALQQWEAHDPSRKLLEEIQAERIRRNWPDDWQAALLDGETLE